MTIPHTVPLIVSLSSQELDRLQEYCQTRDRTESDAIRDWINSLPAQNGTGERRLEEMADLRQELELLKSERNELIQLLATAEANCRVQEKELRDRAAALQDRQARDRLLYDNTPVMLHSIDADGRLIEVNDYWLKKLGYERSEVLGRKSTDFLTPASRRHAEETILPRFFREGACQEIPYQFACKDGTILDVLLSALSLRDESGEVVRSFAAAIDITERKRAEEALRCQECRQRAILGAIPDLLLLVRRDGTCREVILPCSAPAGQFVPLKSHLAEILAPELLQRQLSAIERALATGEVQVYEHQIEKFGSLADEEIRISPLTEDEVLILACDITQHKKAERERDRFFELSPDLLCIANFDGYFLRVNAAWTKTLGFAERDLLASPYLDFVHPEDRARTVREAEKLMAGEQTLQFENRYRAKDGCYRWLLWTAALDPERQLLYAIAHDITERKQAEVELQRSQQELRTIADSVPGIIGYIDAERRYRFVNRTFEKWLCWQREEAIGRPVWEILGEEGYRLVKPHIDRVLAGQPITFETPCFFPGIGKRHVYAQLMPDWAGQDRVKGYYLLVMDISERIEAEAALQLAEDNYRSIFENAMEGIFQSTPDGHYLCVNPAMARLHGYDSPEVMLAAVKNVGQVYADPDCRRQFQRQIEERDAVQDLQYQIVRPDGSRLWVAENTRAVRDRSGNLLYYEGLIQDISERKQAEEALKQQVKTLRIEIDEQRRQQDVWKVMQTEFFQQLRVEREKLNPLPTIEDREVPS